MSASKAVLDGPRAGQSKRFCTKCGHIEYERAASGDSAHSAAAQEIGFTTAPLGSVERVDVCYKRAVTSSAPAIHADARAALARGDFPTAINEYYKVLETHPDDALAYLEVSRTFCDHLEDADAAVATLETALSREWPQADAALLCMRLVDVYWDFHRDAETARALLVQIKETMPGTPHALSAQRRLHEINEAVALQHRQ
jgi:tetratricopeptide (TPR) repeat protein